MLRYFLAPAVLLAACTTPYQTEPIELAQDAIAIDAFGDSTCLIDATGGATCLGDHPPRPTATDPSMQPPFGLPRPAVAIAVGRFHACVILDTGEVACWGDNHGGGLTTETGSCPVAAGPDQPVPTCDVDPVIVPGLAATAIDAGDSATCILDLDAHVQCWGDAAGGRLGHGTLGLAPPATIDVDGAPIRAIGLSLASRRGCAVTDGHALVCWGGDYGAPTIVTEAGPVTAVAVGDDHACAVTTDGGVTCWGEDRNGQAGDFTIAHKCGAGGGPCLVGMTHVVGVGRAVSVAVGARHSCATLDDGTVTCWGSNEWGQLGRADAFLVGEPGRAALSGAAQVTAGRAHTCVRTSDIHVWCFGENDLGQIGGA
jgi:alpha-tubulin suppressor-like RCC1 family protein